jgi:hypothetical protein
MKTWAKNDGHEDGKTDRPVVEEPIINPILFTAVDDFGAR